MKIWIFNIITPVFSVNCHCFFLLLLNIGMFYHIRPTVCIHFIIGSCVSDFTIVLGKRPLNRCKMHDLSWFIVLMFIGWFTSGFQEEAWPSKGGL